MSVPDVAQVGAANEVTYGTYVAPTTFNEFNSESVQEMRKTIEASAMRAGYQLTPASSVKRYPLGAQGDLVFDVQSKGFAFWAKHMLGALAVDGTATDSLYVHVATLDSLYGDSFTMQINRPLNPSEADSQINFLGGKVARWQLECAVQQYLKCTLGLDFSAVEMTTALASASYPSSSEFYSFLEGVVEIADTTVLVDKITIGGDNGLPSPESRLKLGSSTLREPQSGKRQISWTIEMDFDSETQVDRFRSAALSGALAKIELTFTGVGLVGAATYPALKVTLNDALFDEAKWNVGGPEPLKQTLTGWCLQSSSQPIQFDISTAESLA